MNENTLKRIFRKCCPFVKKPTLRNISQEEMLRHIEVYVDNIKLRLESKPNATREEIYQFEKWRRSRQVFKLERLPNYEQEKIKQALEKCLTDNPQVTKVYLTGSFANGDYINEFTPGYYFDLKKKVTGKAKISDIDFVTVPTVVKNTPHYDLVTDQKKNKILLWEK